MKKKNYHFADNRNDEVYFIDGHTDGGATSGLRREEIIPKELKFKDKEIQINGHTYDYMVKTLKQ